MSRATLLVGQEALKTLRRFEQRRPQRRTISIKI